MGGEWGVTDSVIAANCPFALQQIEVGEHQIHFLDIANSLFSIALGMPDHTHLE